MQKTVAKNMSNHPLTYDIRDELSVMGIKLTDNKDGTTTWEVAR